MTTNPGTGRRLPEPAVCPNGHVNRPGTRLCAVCRALIPPAPPAAAPAPPEPPPAATAPEPMATHRPHGPAYWALGLVLLLLVLFVAAFAIYYPVRRRAAFLATAAVVTLPAGAASSASPPTPSPEQPTTAPPPSPTAVLVAPGESPAGTPSPVATITPLSTIVGVVVTPTVDTLPAATVVLGPNLVQNGDFSADWVNGWERTTEGVTGVQTVETRNLSGQPAVPSLAMSKTGAGQVAVSQHIPLAQPPDGLVFRAQVRLAGVAEGGDEGRSALMLLYEDADGNLLGASLWLDGSATSSALWGEALPPFGPTVAPRIQAAGWQTIAVSLAHEFNDRLPDVDPAQVRRITIVLLLAGSDTCPPDACAAELSAAALSLVPGELAP